MKYRSILVSLGTMLFCCSTMAIAQNPYPSGCYTFTTHTETCSDENEGNCQGSLLVIDFIDGSGPYTYGEGT